MAEQTQEWAANLDVWPFPGSDKLVLHRRAWIGIDVVDEADLRLLRQAAEALVGKPPDEWPRLGVPRIMDEEPIYLLRVSPDLRALVVPFGDRVEVLDLVRVETLRRIWGSERGNGAGAAE